MERFDRHGCRRETRSPRTPALDARDVDAALDRITESHPRLRLAPRYKARLTPAVERSLDYAHFVARALPAARLASVGAWRDDPMIRAFFASADDVARELSRSHKLQDYFAQHPHEHQAHVLLGMKLTERSAFGVAREGDTYRHDVPRTTWCFSEHHAHVCAADEPSLRTEISRRVLDELALRGLTLIMADRQQRDQLDQDRALLKSRLRLLELRGAGMLATPSRPATPTDEARLRAALADNERQLAELGGRTDSLSHDLERLHDVLLDPHQYLELFERRARLDALNVLQDDHGRPTGDGLTFSMARFNTAPPQTRTFALVRFPRGELLSPTDLLDEAARALA
ncbi:hypothetical protein [Aquabacterium sp.]|uniref:hypothetical protein n=1 Tax=Aquabacterium sp. TaxID=1872578 RepID=UPI0035AE7C8F